ncbi:MAG: hypothetical protein R3B47_11185 [Bacteroidia bacterium]
MLAALSSFGCKKAQGRTCRHVDPLATSGLLIVCTGKATKTIDSLMGQMKEYEATIRWRNHREL